MSSNKSVPQPTPNAIASSDSQGPDYVGLAKFLFGPFLDSPELLRVDCELLESKHRVWLRLAFDNSDKGRVFGRGGRNIQAIRTVLAAIAQSAGQSIYLDIYGGLGEHRHSDSSHSPSRRRSTPPPSRRSSPRKPQSQSNSS
jgi:hypothetical protein